MPGAGQSDPKGLPSYPGGCRTPPLLQYRESDPMPWAACVQVCACRMSVSALASSPLPHRHRSLAVLKLMTFYDLCMTSIIVRESCAGPQPHSFVLVYLSPVARHCQNDWR